MSPGRLLIAPLFLLLSTGWVLAQESSADSRLKRAQRLVDDKPGATHCIGLAEMKRASGSMPQALAELQRAGKTADIGNSAIECQELLCWRMLPPGKSNLAELKKEVDKLGDIKGTSDWKYVFDLHLMIQNNDRAALLQAISDAPKKLPERFPTGLGERAHLDLLQEVGWPKGRAGLDVLLARDYSPLHVLLDFDRALSREAEFLKATGKNGDARRAFAVRDRLREAYLKSSRHVKERLIFLELLGKTEERDALLAKARAINYLNDPKALRDVFEKLGEDQFWKLVIQPLLTSEVNLIESPPDLTRFRDDPITLMNVRARKKIGTTYEGDVRVDLGRFRITCERLTVVERPAGKSGGAAVLLTGAENVVISGFLTFPRGIRADHFSFNSDFGDFTFGGDVQLGRHDAAQKLRACIVTSGGDVRESSSLLADFDNLKDIPAKLELLKKITRVYNDDELPAEVSYLLALNLLRPHLTWHAPYLPPRQMQDQYRDYERAQEKVLYGSDHYRWEEAMPGETWMASDVPAGTKDAFRQAVKAWHKPVQDAKVKEVVELPPPVEINAPIAFAWRLRDPHHTDLTRIRRLLQSARAKSGESGNKINEGSHRWLAELERNNTIVTFDIPGGSPAGKDLPVVVDVRNGDRLHFKVYRVQRAEDLVWASGHIGTDYIYRDYELQDRDRDNVLMKVIEELKRARAMESKWRIEDGVAKEAPPPEFKREQLVHQWDIAVADLKPLDLSHLRHRIYSGNERDWDEDSDEWYFGDSCREFRRRLDKDYKPGPRQINTWQCSRVVQVPGKALPKPGAYILVAECNGQKAYVPLLVDPISLTLRRCRDGVFVLASSADGAEPLAGAQVHAKQMLGKTITDNEGAAFARIFAAGNRSVIVEHEGRFAIGGFGKVFEGIYKTVSESDEDYYRRWYHPRDQMKRMSEELSALVYADAHVVAGYTDRPTYRPGQTVQFKLIVRKLTSSGRAEPREGPDSVFRAADFDQTKNLALPDIKEPVDFTVLDPMGQEVGSGVLNLNDFGTAAGKITLEDEAKLGSYSMRMMIAGSNRIVPGVFVVEEYRLPNFEIDIAGVPLKLKNPEEIPVTISGKYYFGKPVAQGKVAVRLVRADRHAPLAEEDGRLDENGKIELSLTISKKLMPGRHYIICDLSDDSGRTISKSVAVEIEGDLAGKNLASKSLGALPRFIAAGQEIRVTTSADIVWADSAEDSLGFRAAKGEAVLKLTMPGWHRLSAGDERAELFVYGGRDHPYHHDYEFDDGEPTRWVNLTDFRYEHHSYGYYGYYGRQREHPLLALFDRQHVEVGDKLRVLVYVPRKKARLLFTMEGRTVLDYFTAWTNDETTGYRVVEIPIKDRLLPNFYLQGRIVVSDADPALGKNDGGYGARPGVPKEAGPARRDDGLDPRWCRIDVLDSQRQAGTDRLKVAVETDRPEFRPGEVVNVKLRVTDLEGRPRLAEVSLGAVDESVYSFGEDRLSSISAFFASPREERRFLPKPWRSSLGNKWHAPAAENGHAKAGEAKASKDLAKRQNEQTQEIAMLQKSVEKLSQAMRSVEKGDTQQVDRRPVPVALLGGDMPVGQVPLARMRLEFRETATWQPQLRTDADGKLTASFKLPDSLTKYRLTALALTRETEVGVGRASVKASLPLAVQVMLPRFAVEGDRLLAVGLVHNNTNKERDCLITWAIKGATPEDDPAAEDRPLVKELGRTTTIISSVTVPAHGTARVIQWLKFDRTGTAIVALTATSDKDADAETRTLPVHTLGRAREITANGVLDGSIIQAGSDKSTPTPPGDKVNGSAAVKLPAGFVADELQLSMSCTDVAQAMDGLEYLVDYPYGCVEQTMSRFLPAVMVKHATQRAPVVLPPQTALKLPDVLAKGLAKLYGYQHEDGGWGWWEKDATNDGMSIYVVYGLARCQKTGTIVDEAVLERGCKFLQKRLRDGDLPRDLAGRAWYALALAGHADAKELENEARQSLQRKDESLEARCNLALACRAGNLNETGERLWNTLKTWHPDGADRISLKLNAQIAYGSLWIDCRFSAQRLLRLRQGTRWENTRATSWALEALAEMLRYVPERAVVRRAQAWVDGQPVLSLTDPVELKMLVYHLHLVGRQYLYKDAAAIRMTVDSSDPVAFALRAVGTQRMDKLEPTGTRIKMLRTLETLDGKTIKGPVKVGQVLRVRLQLDLAEREEHLLIMDRRPAGCEYADEQMDGNAARNLAHAEFRDDRVCAFHSSLNAGRHELIYYLRAETAGISQLLPGCAYPMYNEAIRGETGADRLEVK